MRAIQRLVSPLGAEWTGALITAAVYVAMTAVLVPLLGTRHIVDVVLLYLLACLFSAAAWGFRVGLVSAVAAQLIVNFFYVPPVHRFTVQRPENTVALFLFLAVAAVGASMLSLFRRQVQVAAARQAETAVLLELSQQSARAVTPRDATERLCAAMARALGAKGCALLRFDDGWSVAASSGASTLSRDEAILATQALESSQVVRFGGAVRSRIPAMPRRANERSLTFVPFRSLEAGALRFDGPLHGPAGVGIERLLLAFADEASVALHRTKLAEEASRLDALEQADAFKTALLSSVSHDLRTPLTAIKASVGSLRDHEVEWTEADREAFLETIESQTDRLSATVSGLLQMSRLEAGAVRPLLETVQVEPLLREAVVAAGAALAGRQVDVNVAPGLWVRADYGLTLTALTNLVQNAGKYATPGTPVLLSAKALGGRVQISVADSGPGISSEDLPRIFDKFYRGRAGKDVSGSGLGLSIVKAMVELSGGIVAVRSSSDGTVFTIELPAAGAP